MMITTVFAAIRAAPDRWLVKNLTPRMAFSRTRRGPPVKTGRVARTAPMQSDLFRIKTWDKSDRDAIVYETNWLLPKRMVQQQMPWAWCPPVLIAGRLTYGCQEATIWVVHHDELEFRHA